MVIAGNTKLVAQQQKNKEMKQTNVGGFGEKTHSTLCDVIRQKNKVDSLLTYYNNTTGAAALMVVEESLSVLI